MRSFTERYSLRIDWQGQVPCLSIRNLVEVREKDKSWMASTDRTLFQRVNTSSLTATHRATGGQRLVLGSRYVLVPQMQPRYIAALRTRTCNEYQPPLQPLLDNELGRGCLLDDPAATVHLVNFKVCIPAYTNHPSLSCASAASDMVVTLGSGLCMPLRMRILQTWDLIPVLREAALPCRFYALSTIVLHS